MKIKKTKNKKSNLSNHIFEFTGYNFRNEALLKLSLTHSLNKPNSLISNNQRLEFLGDRVLGIIVAKLIYDKFPNENEGQLSKRFSELVSKKVLAKISKFLELQKLIQINNSLKNEYITESIIADTLEALICAIFLDSDFDETQKIVKKLWIPEVNLQIYPPDNPKSKLQEWCLEKKINLPEYTVISKEGPDHKPKFTVKLTIRNLLSHTSEGKSIQEAEIKAAKVIVNKLNE